MKTLRLIFILGTAGVPNVAAQKLAPLCPDGVKVFYAPSDVGKEYQQVQWLHARGETGYSDEAMILRNHRREAAHVGANGIIVDGWHRRKHQAMGAEELGDPTREMADDIPSCPALAG